MMVPGCWLPSGIDKPPGIVLTGGFTKKIIGVLSFLFVVDFGFKYLLLPILLKTNSHIN